MARIRLKHVTADRDRHDNVRYYFRKRGLKAKTRLPGSPGTDEFMRAYEALLAGNPIPTGKWQKPVLGKVDATSLRWLFLRYLASPEYKQLDVKTRDARRHILTAISDLPISETNRKPIGDLPFTELTAKSVRRIRDRKADTPAMANSWMKTLRVVFTWGIDAEVEHCTHNPAKDVPNFKPSASGHHAWTLEEIAQFQAKFPAGTTQYLALALLLYTGQRISDVVTFGPQHIRDGWLRFTQHKNRNRKPVTLSIPMLSALSGIVAATSSGHLTFIVNARGASFSAAVFSKRFSAWCNDAGLPHCTAHGLRKAGATLAAQNGATASQLMAIFGWRNIDQAELYTRSADQKRLAGDSMHLIKLADKS